MLLYCSHDTTQLLVLREYQRSPNEAAQQVSNSGKLLVLIALSARLAVRDESSSKLTIGDPMARIYASGIPENSSINCCAAVHASAKVTSSQANESVFRS